MFDHKSSIVLETNGRRSFFTFLFESSFKIRVQETEVFMVRLESDILEVALSRIFMDGNYPPLDHKTRCCNDDTRHPQKKKKSCVQSTTRVYSILSRSDAQSLCPWECIFTSWKWIYVKNRAEPAISQANLSSRTGSQNPQNLTKGVVSPRA